jgi:hypothetical protein
MVFICISLIISDAGFAIPFSQLYVFFGKMSIPHSQSSNPKDFEMA